MTAKELSEFEGNKLGVWTRGIIWLGLSGALLAVFRIPTFQWSMLNVDEASWIVCAQSINAGGIPYRDVYDIKPPGLFLIYWLSQFISPWGYAGSRFLLFIANLATVGVLIRITRTMGFPAAGPFTAVLFAFGVATPSWLPRAKDL
jgi:hypothetical protein